MSPAGLSSLARSRRPRAEPAWSPGRAAASPSGQEAEHSQSGAWLCLHGCSALAPQAPSLPSHLLSGLPSSSRGPNPILSMRENHPITQQIPPGRTWAHLATAIGPLVRTQGCGGLTREPGAGLCCVFRRHSG